MKKTVLFVVMTVVAMAVASCGSTPKDGACHIHGTVTDKALEGKRIFLVPLTGPATAATVDSVEIKDGKFEFTPDSMQMYKILMDYHFRMGTQTLLVVAEPGNVNVTIGSISHANGTPQNDSLEKWKDVTEKHNLEYRQLSKASLDAKNAGRKAEADSLEAEARRVHVGYKKFTRRMSENLKEGVLHEFLGGLYPLTYKRKMSDGTIVVMDADTNEPVAK